MPVSKTQKVLWLETISGAHNGNTPHDSLYLTKPGDLGHHLLATLARARTHAGYLSLSQSRTRAPIDSVLKEKTDVLRRLDSPQSLGMNSGESLPYFF